MISNPYLPSPSAAQAWAEGFVKGFTGPQYSTEPPSNIAADDTTPYAEGVIAGQESATNGLDFSEPCVAAADEASEAGHMITGVEALHAGLELRHLKTLGAGLAGFAVMLIELACTLPKRTLPPEQVLPSLGETLVQTLSAYGVESFELFCGAGLDATSQDCEIRLSPMYVSLEQATQAAKAMGRPEWVVVSWRTDQSRSFRIVESS